jgi:hypothetical protein
MDPQRAAKMGIKPEDIKVECHGDKYNGHWFIHVPAYYDDERGYAILTSSPDIYKLCVWQSHLRILTNGA